MEKEIDKIISEDLKQEIRKELKEYLKKELRVELDTGFSFFKRIRLILEDEVIMEIKV